MKHTAINVELPEDKAKELMTAMWHVQNAYCHVPTRVAKDHNHHLSVAVQLWGYEIVIEHVSPNGSFTGYINDTSGG